MILATLTVERSDQYGKSDVIIVGVFESQYLAEYAVNKVEATYKRHRTYAAFIPICINTTYEIIA